MNYYDLNLPGFRKEVIYQDINYRLIAVRWKAGIVIVREYITGDGNWIEQTRMSLLNNERNALKEAL